VLDCIVTASVDVDFELMWRNGGDTVVLSSWSKHFDPAASGHDAQAYELDKAAPAVGLEDGAQLVFRYTARNTTGTEAWIPNGDGHLAHGRIPSITLPP
jgi:hypothetical protein